MGQVAGILAVIPDILAEHFGSHTMNGASGEEVEGFGDSDRRDAGVLRKTEVLHGVDFARRLILQVLPWIEITGCNLVGRGWFNDRLPVGGHDARWYETVGSAAAHLYSW